MIPPLVRMEVLLCQPNPILRATPFRKLTALFCRLPLPTFLYWPEVTNLGILMRLSVRSRMKPSRSLWFSWANYYLSNALNFKAFFYISDHQVSSWFISLVFLNTSTSLPIGVRELWGKAHPWQTHPTPHPRPPQQDIPLKYRLLWLAHRRSWDHQCPMAKQTSILKRKDISSRLNN